MIAHTKQWRSHKSLQPLKWIKKVLEGVQRRRKQKKESSAFVVCVYRDELYAKEWWTIHGNKRKWNETASRKMMASSMPQTYINNVVKTLITQNQQRENKNTINVMLKTKGTMWVGTTALWFIWRENKQRPLIVHCNCRKLKITFKLECAELPFNILWKTYTKELLWKEEKNEKICNWKLFVAFSIIALFAQSFIVVAVGKAMLSVKIRGMWKCWWIFTGSWRLRGKALKVALIAVRRFPLEPSLASTASLNAFTVCPQMHFPRFNFPSLCHWKLIFHFQ